MASGKITIAQTRALRRFIYPALGAVLVFVALFAVFTALRFLLGIRAKVLVDPLRQAPGAELFNIEGARSLAPRLGIDPETLESIEPRAEETPLPAPAESAPPVP